MKKQEILTALANEKVTSSNLTSFLQRRKANRELIGSVEAHSKRAKQIKGWLEVKEAKEAASKQKGHDKAKAKSFSMSLNKFYEL